MHCVQSDTIIGPGPCILSDTHSTNALINALTA